MLIEALLSNLMAVVLKKTANLHAFLAKRQIIKNNAFLVKVVIFYIKGNAYKIALSLPIKIILAKFVLNVLKGALIVALWVALNVIAKMGFSKRIINV
jgi:hypothetical protein